MHPSHRIEHVFSEGHQVQVLAVVMIVANGRVGQRNSNMTIIIVVLSQQELRGRSCTVVALVIVKGALYGTPWYLNLFSFCDSFARAVVGLVSV